MYTVHNIILDINLLLTVDDSLYKTIVTLILLFAFGQIYKHFLEM